MSDFLSNLVEKGQNLTATIEPQLPSLFASWINTVGWSPASQFPDPFDSDSAKEEVSSSEKGFEVLSTTQLPTMPGLVMYDLDPDSISQQSELTNSQKYLNEPLKMIGNQQTIMDQRPPSSMPPMPEIVDKKTNRFTNQSAQGLEQSTSLQSPKAFLEYAEDKILAKSVLKQPEKSPPIITPTTEKAEISTRSHQIISEKQSAPLLFSMKKNIVSEEVVLAKETVKTILPHINPTDNKKADQKSSEKDLSQQVAQWKSPSDKQMKNGKSVPNRPTLRMAVLQPRSLQHEEPAVSLSPKEVERAESAPAIRVNIGRIEVRAVMPSGTSMQPQRTKSTPILSLDEYLKQRNGR